MFVKPVKQPTVQEMWAIYREVRRNVSTILNQAGSKSLYNASVFRELCLAANASAERYLS